MPKKQKKSISKSSNKNKRRKIKKEHFYLGTVVFALIAIASVSMILRSMDRSASACISYNGHEIIEPELNVDLMFPPMKIMGDYIQTLVDDEGKTRIVVQIEKSGVYKMIGNVKADSNKSNSFKVKLGRFGEEIIWDVNWRNDKSKWGEWYEEVVSERGNGTINNPENPVYAFDLAKGYHVIEIIGAEANTKLDYLKLVEIETEPVAYWKFDKGSGAMAEDSAGDNDGIIKGADWGSGCVSGACMSFSGYGDYVDTPFTHDSSKFTVSVWAYIDNNGISKRTILANERGGGYAIKYSGKDEFVEFSVKTEGGKEKMVATPAEENEWVNLALTFNGGNFKSFVNGDLVRALDVSDSAYDNPNGKLVIGKDKSNSPKNYFAGKIDEVSLYDYALTDEQIKELYNSFTN